MNLYNFSMEVLQGLHSWKQNQMILNCFTYFWENKNVSEVMENTSKVVGYNKRMVYPIRKKEENRSVAKLKIKQNWNPLAKILVCRYMINIFKYLSDVKFTAFFYEIFHPQCPNITTVNRNRVNIEKNLPNLSRNSSTGS